MSIDMCVARTRATSSLLIKVEQMSVTQPIGMIDNVICPAPYYIDYLHIGLIE